MARPKKSTVDYFPHVTDHGKTMFILESRYGNDGYAVFFKILEQLGKTEDHYINCNSSTTWEFLTAYCRVEGSLLRKILDLCASIDAIDPEFWASGYIFSQNFIEGIKDAYRLRKMDIPSRGKVSNIINMHINKFPTLETQTSGVSNAINGEMKLNEMKLNESKSSSSSDDEKIDDDDDQKMSLKDFSKLFYQTYSKMMPSGLNQDAQEICRHYPRDKIKEAFSLTAEFNGRTFKYFRSVLEGKQHSNDYLDEIFGGTG